MNQQIHQIGERLVKLRARLQAREHTPGFEKNCAAIREEIARLERATIPEFDDDLVAAEVAEKASAVASEDQSGE